MSEMRKHVVLLAFGVIVSSMTATVAGCGSSALLEQDSAPSITAVPVREAAVIARSGPGPTSTPAPTAVPSPMPSPVPAANPSPTLSPVPMAVPSPTSSPVPAPDPTPTPSPVPAADDGLEFMPNDSLETSGKDEGITEVGQGASQKSGSPTGPVQGPAYTWEDGDRTLTAYLQADLVVEKGSDGMPRDIIEADDGGTNVVRSADIQSEGNTLPVFRSESGSLMTLPGGILLVLSAERSQAETDAFFSDNDVKMDRVSELSYVANGFFVETEPGYPSLDLANRLAALDGVEVSSPNWGREATPK